MQKKYNRIFIIVLLTLVGCSTLIKNEVNISKSVYPGEVEKLVLDQIEGELPEFFICAGKKIFIQGTGTNPYILWSESYFSKGNKYFCSWETSKSKVLLNISVEDKEYPKEKLRVDGKRVKLNKRDLQRVTKEREVLAKVYSSGSHFPRFVSKFNYPLKSKVTSVYGVKRVFNGIRKSQHLGIDFRARVGRKIPAANAGDVVLAQNLFYTGNTVIISHGAEIYTLYGHLSKIFVKEGEAIQAGRVLGLAGKTGRVTGPHLHWGVKVQGNWVNGSSLVNLNIP